MSASNSRPVRRALGRRSAKNAPALRLSAFLAPVPVHPAQADHLTGIADWGLWGNDHLGTCGPVSFFNYLKLITYFLTGVEAQPTIEEIYGLYRLCNPDFDPRTGAGDNGVDMQTMLELAKANDVLGNGKLVAFARVDLTNLDEVRAAISIFGGVLLGVTLDTAQDGQTDSGLWDYVRRSPVWGGHAVLAGMYDSDVADHHSDIEIITWARRIGTSAAFQNHQLDEAWVVILKEHLDHPEFQKGIDLAGLASAYQAITGDAFPVPLPVPEPTQDELFTRFLAWLPSAWDEFRRRL
jgi:hypothetical protein